MLAGTQVDEEGRLERESAQQDLAVLEMHAPHRGDFAQQGAGLHPVPGQFALDQVVSYFATRFVGC